MLAVVVAFSFGHVGGVAAQSLPDPARAKALDKCHIVLSRTATKVAVKKLKSLAKCSNGILKCVETKPGVARCVAQAGARCNEQLAAGAVAEAAIVDTIVRKCGSDLAVDDLLISAGLDVESLRDECQARFGLGLTSLAEVGDCLARQQACELERLLAISAPRTASLLALANVDPAARTDLACLTDFGGADEHVADPRGVGRPLERCARAVTNASLKLVESSRKSIGRCLETLFTCVQVKNDAGAAPACQAKAQKRCALDLANLAAAAGRPAPALASACSAIEDSVLRAPEGLRLAALDALCAAAGTGPTTSLAAYAACLTATHRCGIAALTRFTSPRADELLARVGTSLGAALCPALVPTPTATPIVASATPIAATATPIAATATPTTATATPDGTTPTPGGPSGTPTPTLAVPTETAIGPTASPTPTCADAFEPSAFPNTPVAVDDQCGGTCTDDGFDILVEGTINVAGESDFYVLDVVDLVGHNFSLTARLSDIPDDTNYDLYLYRLDGSAYMPLDSSTNDGTGNEVVSFSGSGDRSGRYGVEVRGIAGTSCEPYRLEIGNPN